MKNKSMHDVVAKELADNGVTEYQITKGNRNHFKLACQGPAGPVLVFYTGSSTDWRAAQNIRTLIRRQLDGRYRGNHHAPSRGGAGS